MNLADDVVGLAVIGAVVVVGVVVVKKANPLANAGSAVGSALTGCPPGYTQQGGNIFGGGLCLPPTGAYANDNGVVSDSSADSGSY